MVECKVELDMYITALQTSCAGVHSLLHHPHSAPKAGNMMKKNYHENGQYGINLQSLGYQELVLVKS